MWIAILGACLGAAVLTLVAATIGLRRANRRAADITAQVDRARGAVRAVVEEETQAHVEEIKRTLARERSLSTSALVEDERKLGEERRLAFLERERHAGEELTDRLTRTERRLDEKLRGFTDDLERAQRHLAQQVTRLEQTQQTALASVAARIELEAAALGTSADEQRRAVHRLREELEHAASQAVQAALDELESSTAERRRAIDEITDRLRARETAIAQSLDRAETDVKARLDVLLVEWEKRQTARLARVLDRDVEHYAQLTLQQVDERVRAAREEAVSRLQRELDRTINTLATEGLGRGIGSQG